MPRPADAFRRLGVEPTPATRQLMTARLSGTGLAAPGQHRYTLERYGRAPGEVRETFSGYLAASSGG